MDYTSYTTIKSELKTQLSLLSGWATTLYYGVYDAIISMVAYAINKDAYLGYYLYKETGWSTAENVASLVGQSWLLGYTPHRKMGASGSIVLSGSSTFSGTYVWQGSSVFIPKWTKFCNNAKSTNVYCSSFTTYYNGTTGNCTVPVKEGTPKQYTYIASGNVDEKIYLYSNKIDNEGIEVFIVDSLGNVIVQVEIVENLYFLDEPNTYYCSITNSPNFDYIYFTFGDNISTKQLDAGTYVLIKYAETNGDTGNVSGTGIITKINDVLYNNNGDIVTNVYITNQSIISGGDTYEDIESIRNNAPNLFGAGYRCGTLADWNSVVNSISYVDNAKVWSINSIGGSTLISEQNTIYITAIDAYGNALSQTQQYNLVKLLEDNYSSPTEIIQFEDPKKIYMYFDISSTISGSTSSVMDNNIKTVLYDNYATLNSSFARKVYQSEYIKLISSLSNIVYCDAEAKMMDYNIGYAVSELLFIGYYSATASEDKVLVTYGSPEIWIKRKIAGVWQTPQKIGVASGTTFVPTYGSTYTFSNATISYIDYKYSFIIDQILDDSVAIGAEHQAIYGVNNPGDTDPLGYIVNMVYATQDGNGGQTNSIRLGQMNYITDIDTDFIFNTITES